MYLLFDDTWMIDTFIDIFWYKGLIVSFNFAILCNSAENCGRSNTCDHVWSSTNLHIVCCFWYKLFRRSIGKSPLYQFQTQMIVTKHTYRKLTHRRTTNWIFKYVTFIDFLIKIRWIIIQIKQENSHIDNYVLMTIFWCNYLQSKWNYFPSKIFVKKSEPF